jgi:hypothetical protein
MSVMHDRQSYIGRFSLSQTSQGQTTTSFSSSVPFIEECMRMIIDDDIVDDIYRHAEIFMHERDTIMEPDYVGEQEDLYLWCLIGESKTCRQYACPMHYSCGCGTGIRITETKQTLRLETIGVHDQHSHIRGKMHARKSAPGVGGVSRHENEASANDESGGPCCGIC